MTENLDPLISVSAAAREIGVHQSTISKQVRDGSIRSHDGKVRLSEVLADRAANIDLGRSNRRRGAIDDPGASGASPPAGPEAGDDGEDDAAGQPPVVVDGALMDYGAARAMKESYVALLRKLEFDTKRGDLGPVADMVAFVERMFATVRELLLGIPGKLAGDLTDEQAERLTAEIHETLEELSDPHAFLDGTESLDDDGGEGGDDPAAAPAPEPRRMGRDVPVRRAEDKRRPG